MIPNSEIEKNISEDLSKSMRFPYAQRFMQVITMSSLNDEGVVVLHDSLSCACRIAYESGVTSSVISMSDGILWILKRDTIACTDRKISCLSYYEAAANIKSSRAAGPVHIVDIPEEVISILKGVDIIKHEHCDNTFFSPDKMKEPIPIKAEWTRIDAFSFHENEIGNSYPSGTEISIDIPEGQTEVLVKDMRDGKIIGVVGYMDQIVDREKDATCEHYLLTSEKESLHGWTGEIVASHRGHKADGKSYRRLIIHGPPEFFNAINRLRGA